MDKTQLQDPEIWLHNDKALAELQKITGIDQVSLIRKILLFLFSEELTENGVEDAGQDLKYCFERDGGVKLQTLAQEIFASPQVVGKLADLLGSLVIKASIDDCPQCGCETEAEQDGGYGHVWTIRKCTNADCDFEHSTEPDFPDHKDYYNR